MKKVIFPILVLYCSTSFAQPGCSCRENFSKLLDKLETNYIAFHLEKAGLDKRYQAHKERYQKIAKGTSLKECARLLHAFTSFFKDRHVFVAEFPGYTKVELEGFRKKISSETFDTGHVKAYLLHKKNRHPIEGLWTDGSSKFAIISDPSKRNTQKFIAVILEGAERGKPGEIKMTLADGKRGVEGEYYDNDYAPRYVTADLYKDASLLYLSGGIYWGRLHPDSAQDLPLYQPANPSLAVINNKYALISLPSFLIEGNVLDAFLIANLKVLSEIPYWIVDIRGNIGGNGIYFNLISGYYERAAKAEPPGFAFASPDNLSYFSTLDNGNGPYTPVVMAMKDSMNQLVTGPRFNDIILSRQPTALRKVIILTDRSNMSAAETFVLHSKAMSTKVITMGDYTAGVVDYNNINMVKLACDKQNILLGYPTYSRTADLHKNGYNKTGIKPDILIGKGVKDKIAFAIDFLEKNEQ